MKNSGQPSAFLPLGVSLCRFASALAFCAAIAAGTARSSAATVFWDRDASALNGATDGAGIWANQGAATFFDPLLPGSDVAALTTDTVVFGNGGVGGTVNLGGAITVDGLRLGVTTTTGYTLTATSAQTLTIGSGGIVMDAGAQASTVGSANLTIALGAAQSFTNNSASLLTVGGPITDAGNFLLTLNAASTGSITLSGIITGAPTSGVTVASTGTGNVTLSGVNTYTGATTIQSGALVAGGNSPSGAVGVFGNSVSAIALGTATSVTSNLSSTLLTGGAFTVARNITVGANTGLTTGIYTVGGNTATSSTFSGILTLNQPLSITQISGGTLFFTNNLTAVGSTQTITFNNIGSVTQSAGVISGGAGLSLVKSGIGATTLSGTNTYTGTTTIQSGTLIAGVDVPLAVAGAFGNSAADIPLGTATTITGNLNVSLLTGGAVTIARNIIAGASNGVTSGIYTIGGNTANPSTISGTTTLNQSLTVSQIAGGTLNLSGNITLAAGTQTLRFNNAGTVNQSAGVIGGAGTLAVLQSGAGITTLSGVNTYTGGNTISAGTLSVGVTGNLGAAASNLVFDGGTLRITGTTLANFSGIGHVVSFNAGKTVGLDINTGAHTFTADQILNQTTGGLSKLGAGTVVVNQANTYTGTTTVSLGTLTAGVVSVTNVSGAFGLNSPVVMANAAGTLNLAGFNTQIGSLSGGGPGLGNVTLGSATLTVGGDNTSPAPFFGNISGAGGSVVKIGAGTQFFSGANTYTGTTSVLGGTLVLDYFGNNTAKLSSTAALTLGGATLQLDQSAPFVSSNILEVVASTTLSGAASITRPDSFSLSVLQMNAISRASGGSVDFSLPNIATTDNLNTNGILGAWATVGNADWAINSGSTTVAGATVPGSGVADGFVRAFSSYTDVTRLNSGPQVIANAPATNVRIVQGTGAAANITLGAGTTTINTLNQSISGGNGAAVIVTAGQTLAVNGILMGSGAGALTIGTAPGSGTLTTATAGGELILQNFSLNILTVNSNIANNAGSGLTHSGSGTTVLAGTNNHSGATAINGGTLSLTGSLTGGTAITIGGNASLLATGVISGAASSITQSSTGSSVLLGLNTFTGKTIINGGSLTIGAETGLGSNPTFLTADQLTLNGGALLSSSTFSIDDTNRGITLGAAGGTFGIGTGSTLTIASTNVITGPGGLTLTGSGALVLTGANTYTGSTTINGGSVIISDPASLGTGTAKIVVNGSATRAAGGGSLVLSGNFASGVNLSRDIDIMGLGPISDRGAALISVRNNTLSGIVSRSTANALITQIYSAGGLLQFIGTLNLTGVANSQFITLGGVNAVGVGNFEVTGTLTGTGSMQKTSAGTLILNPSNSSGFSGTIRVSGGGTVRLVNDNVLGTRTGPLAANIGVNSVLDMNGGTLEIRMDAPAINVGGSAALVYGRASSTFFVDHSLAGNTINGTATFGTLTMQGGQTYTVNGRDGYGVTFADTPINGGNSAAFTNNLNGPLTLNGGVWRNTDTTARTLTFQGNGDTLVTSYIIASGADHFLTKTGNGVITFTGANSNGDSNSTFRGATSVNGGTLAVTNIVNLLNQGTTATTGSNNAINLGLTTGATPVHTPGALSYLGAIGTGAGETTPVVINLASASAAGILFANQSGSSPSALIFGSSVAASGAGIKNLILSGSAAGSIVNEIRGVIQENSAPNKTSIIKAGGTTWLYAPAVASFAAAGTTSVLAGSDTTSGATSASTSVTLASALPPGIVAGFAISGTGIAAGTTITTVTDPTHIILSAQATIANGVTVTFGSRSNTNSLVVVNPAGITVGQLVSGGTNVPAGSVVTNISGNTVTLSGNIGTAIVPTTAITFGAITNFTGGVTVTGGTFQVRPTATTGNGSAPLTASNPLTFNADTANFGNQWAGGTFEYANNAPGSVGVALSVGALTPTAGAGLVKIDAPLVSGTNAVTFTSLGPVANGTGLSFLSPAGTSVTVTGAVNVNGIINAHLYYGNTGTTGGTDFALSTAGVIGPASYTASPGGASLATLNTLPYLLNGNITAQTNATIRAGIKVASVRTIVLAAGQTMTLQNGAATFAGGILVTGGNSLGISGGTGITSGGSADLVFRADTATDVITLSTPMLANTTGGFTKNGLGTLVLNAVNLEAAATINVNEGTLRLSGATTTLGANNMSLNLRQGATLDLNGVNIASAPVSGTATQNLNGFAGAGTIQNLVAATNVTLQIGNNNASTLFSGLIVDGGSVAAGRLNLNKTGIGAEALTGLNTFTGEMRISGGTVQVLTLANIGSASGIGRGDAANNAGSLVFNNGTLQYTGDTNSSTNIWQATQTPSVSIDRLFTLAGNGTIDSSGGYGNVVATGRSANSAALVFNNTAPVVFSGAGTRTLTLTGDSTGDNRMGLQLNNNGTDALALTKSGGGVWVLGNASNLYSGATTINSGVLRAQNGSSLPLLSNLVLNGGVLESAGSFVRTYGNSGSGTVNWANGGFAAAATKLTVSIGGATPTWNNSPNFVLGSMTLNSGTALAEVEIPSGFAITPGVAKTISVTTIANTATVTLTSGTTLDLAVGQVFTGNANIPAGSTIASILSSSQFTLSTGAGVIAATSIATTSVAGGFREIIVNDNANTNTDFATITGTISGSGVLRKSGGGVLQLLGANTHTGRTQVTAGILVVNTLGNSATPAGTSVGNSTGGNTSGQAIALGNGGAGAGILQYVGAGETSDRMISLFTTTGSDQIHADGSGPLILTNVTNDPALIGAGVTVAGNKTLFLRGSNAQANEIRSNLTDNGGTLGITVDGGATWVLPGLSTYTGLTTVNGGALGVGSSSNVGFTAGPVGTGTLALTGGIFFAYAADRSIANPVSGGTYTFIGDYSLTFTGTYTSNVTVNANTTVSVTTTNNIGQNGLLPDKFLSLGRVAFNNIPSNSTVNYIINGTGNTVVTGAISNAAGSLNLAFNPPKPTNTLTLSGASTYTGATILQNGRTILAGGSDNHLPPATTLTLGNGANVAVLQLGDANGVSNLTVSSPFKVTPNLPNPPTVTNGPVVTVAGTGTTNAIVGGSSAVSSFGVFVTAVDPGTGIILPDAILATTSPGALLLGTSSLSGPVGNEANLRLVKLGPGNLQVSGTRYYTGGTDVGTLNGIDAGILKMGSNFYLGTNSSPSLLNVYGGTADIGSTSQFVTNLNLGAGGGNSAAIVTIPGGTLTIKGDITYNATNNPKPATISGIGKLDFKPAAPFTPNSFTTITVGSSAAGSGIGAPDLTISSAIATGTTDIHKQGAGTLRMVPNPTTLWNGSVVLNAGTLILDGSAAANAGGYSILAPGSSFIVNSATKLNLGSAEGDIVTLNQLTVRTNSTLVFNLGAPNPAFPFTPATSDVLDLAALVLDSAVAGGRKVDINKLPTGFGVGHYTLLTAGFVQDLLGSALTPTNSTFSLGTAPGGFRYVLSVDNPSGSILDLNLDVTLLPPGFFWKGTLGTNWSSHGAVTSNWLDAAGGAAVDGFPGIGNNVTFSATGATNSANTTVDINIGANQLIINDPLVSTISGANGTILTLAAGLNIAAGPVAGTTLGGAANANPALDKRLFVGVLNSQTWSSNGGGTLTVLNQLFSAASSGTQTITFDGAKDTIISGNVIDGGLGGKIELLQASGSKLTLTNPANAYSGGTTIGAGTVAFGAGSLPAGGAVTFVGNATLQWLGVNTDDISDRLKINNGQTGTLDVGSNNVTFATQIQAGVANLTTGILKKTGSGTLKLGAPLSASGGYTGGTNINQGTLEFVAGAFPLYNTFNTSLANITFTGTLPTDNPTLKWSVGNTTANWSTSSDGDVSDRLRIADGVNATLDTNGNDVTFSAATILDGTPTSTGSLTKAGLGTLTLATSQRTDATPGPAGYSGGTNIFNGTLEFVSGALPVTGLVTFNNTSVSSTATLRWITNAGNPVNTLDISDRLQIKTGVTATLDTSGNNVNFASAMPASPGDLVKIGSGTLTFSAPANSNFTGATTVNAGTVVVVAGGLSGTKSVTVSQGSTFALQGTSTDRVNNSATVTLGTGNAGTPAILQINDMSETMGVFTLAGNSVIDFGLADANAQLKFAASAAAPWNGGLSIFNWSGSPSGGGPDQLFFGLDSSGLTNGQLAAISFFSDAGLSPLGNATFATGGEIVPVPEPAGLVALFSGAGFLLTLRRRREAR